MAESAASLRLASGRPISRPALLVAILAELRAREPALAGNFAELVAEAEQRSSLLGHWVKVRAGETLTEDDVKAFCKDQIAHYKVPRYVRFVEEFPMTVTGKMQKYLMRATMAEELQRDRA